MKQFLTLLAATTLTLLLGCTETTSTIPDETPAAETTPTEPESMTPAPESTESKPEAQDDSADSAKTTTLENVKKELTEATEAVRKFTASEMSDYKEKLDKQLADFDKQLDQWKEKAEDLTGDAKKQWQEQLETMNEQRSKLGSEVERLGNASGDAWQDLKTGIEDAWADLKAAAEKATKNFGK